MKKNEALKKITILCVEDDAATREIIEIMLVESVEKLMFADNGLSGLELFTQNRPDLVLTDISMPIMSGLEMSRKIREKDKLIPIVVMTSHSDSELLMEAINSSISHFIPKPLNQDKLINVLGTYAQTKITEEKLTCNNLLLDQYKSIVDESTIVSKTDPFGNIIYVNDKFCKISQYSEEELIGKSHKIIRHPKSETAEFENMWSTIKSGKTWQGTLKNLAKDGSTYIVDSTIKPIVDREGNIREYIAIRHNITDLFNLNLEIEQTQKEILYTLGDMAESHSSETGNHVKRVAEYSKRLAVKFGLSTREIDLIHHAAPMHDIGKIAIPDAILNKPGKLNDSEFTMMKSHSNKGYTIFKSSKRELLKAASIIAHEHHEHYDGRGYPQGLKGEDIHIFGRIVAIADVFDALASERVYKDAWSNEQIIDFFRSEKSKQFDPTLTDIFLDNYNEFLEIRESINKEEV